MKKTKTKNNNKPGPKAAVVKINGNWQDAVKESLTKKKPTSGWPKE
jgi:hypothetical protein